jgi:SH3 domain-containing YSC84-like protein 1
MPQATIRIMRALTVGLILLGLAASPNAFGVDKAELDARIRALTGKFDIMQQMPDKKIPAEYLSKAQGIILLDRTKAGFIFAYEGGNGVALVKDPKTGNWSPAAFVAANEASLGFQVGGQKSFIVILLMNTNSTRMLTDSHFEFGGEARGTAGDSSAGEQGTISSHDLPVLVYADRKGLYGGVAIKGDALTADNDANRAYYDQFMTMKEILLDKKVKSTEAASELAAKLTQYSKVAEK